MSTTARPQVRALPTAALTAAEVAALRDLLAAAFAADEHGGFGEDDWLHALGGTHFLVEEAGRILAHASVVERALEIGGQPARTGYVEAVAAEPARQRQGLGSTVMESVNAHLRERFELGALGTGSQGFYERLGWEVWRGPSGVRVDGPIPLVRATPDEDGYILVLRTPTSPPFTGTEPITCELRPGDVW